MKKFIQFLLLILVIAINANANNINKPISSQYGFIENKGQIIDQNNIPNPNVLYLYNGNGLRVQLRKEGFSYEVINTIKTPKTNIDKELHGKFASQADSFDITYQTHRVDINFKNGNKNAALKPTQPASDFINYYTTGTSEAGVTNVHHFQKVVYENVYPNIDIEFVLNDAANKGKFKYNFIVKPNANLADIKLEFLGANRTSLNQAGNILIETAYGNIEENIPLSYVINNNNSHSTIKANFTALDNNIYGIKAENYNHNQTLVIDPTNWATYYGGSDEDYGYAIKSDLSGNIYFVGSTLSSNNISTSGSFKSTFSGGTGNDAFVVKFNSLGIRQWGTYYGNVGDDYGRGIAIDTSGNILIAGYTDSNTGIATTGTYQTSFGGYIDAFIAKFSPSGTRIWATYFGGSAIEYNYKGITTDQNSNIIITGQTASSSGIATLGAFQTTIGSTSAMDSYIAKFNSTGSIQWSTYFGGAAEEYGMGVTADTIGNVFMVGATSSLTNIASSGAFQTSIISGTQNGFIAKFNSSGVRQWSTYYGGNNETSLSSIVCDVNGNIWTTGASTSSIGISTLGSYQSVIGDTINGDAIILKFNSNGLRLYGTFYGGSGGDNGVHIIIDGNNNIFVCGNSTSTTNIATSGSYQSSYGGGLCDAFLVKFSPSGLRIWGTYFGSNNRDAVYGLTNDVLGNIYLIGNTLSNSNISTLGAFQTIFGGGTNGDAFIAAFSGSNGTLPVKLLSFNAILANEKVNCAWETASEINNDYFTLERSKDGNSFEAVGNVKGHGNSNRNIRYSYTDNNPFSGISYYRLKQTDFDGKYAYSPIKKVGSTEKLATEISLYYENDNPIVKINSLTESIANMELINLNGIKLFTNEQPIIKGENTFVIDGNITKGLYLLKVQVEDEVQYFKVWLK